MITTTIHPRSEGGGSGLRKFESRASLNTTGANESPGMASKFGSSFTVNKHKKVRHLKQTRPPFTWLQRFYLIPISNLRQNHQQQQFRWTSTHLTSSSHSQCQNEEKQDSLRFLAPSLLYNVTSECFHFVLLIGFITNANNLREKSDQLRRVLRQVR